MNKAKKKKKSLVRNTEGGCALFLPSRMLTAKPMPYRSQNLHLRNKMVVTRVYRNKFQLISKNFKIYMKVEHNHNILMRSFVTKRLTKNVRCHQLKNMQRSRLFFKIIQRIHKQKHLEGHWTKVAFRVVYILISPLIKLYLSKYLSSIKDLNYL